MTSWTTRRTGHGGKQLEGKASCTDLNIAGDLQSALDPFCSDHCPMPTEATPSTRFFPCPPPPVTDSHSAISPSTTTIPAETATDAALNIKIQRSRRVSTMTSSAGTSFRIVGPCRTQRRQLGEPLVPAAAPTAALSSSSSGPNQHQRRLCTT